VRYWQLDVTFEAGAHLGIETQRQWSEKTIVRTKPGSSGLFSLITLLICHLLQDQELSVCQAASSACG